MLVALGPGCSRCGGKELGALERGAAHLVAAQGEDGSWRSRRYPAFADGTSLTPLILRALLAAHDAGVDGLGASLDAGAAYLAGMAQGDGSVKPGPEGLSYPVYTAAITVQVLGHPRFERHRAARDAWLGLLRSHQLTAELGWDREDAAFGGWGYASEIPHKPDPGRLAPGLVESNMSATTFALEALRSAGAGNDDGAWEDARVFVERCQNYAAGDGTATPGLDDGGFHYIYEDPVRNKAGGPAEGRFNSYGSATADGLRALIALGANKDDPRRRAATTWLTRNFAADHHPGHYVDAREPNRDAIYYYWIAAAAVALRAIEHRGPWATQLIEALGARVRADGTWQNELVDQREDEPLLATAFAVTALGVAETALLP